MRMDHNFLHSLKPMRNNTGCPIVAIFDMCRFSVQGQQRPRTPQIEPEIQRAQPFECALVKHPPFLGSEVSPHTELDELLCFETGGVAFDRTPLTWRVYLLRDGQDSCVS